MMPRDAELLDILLLMLTLGVKMLDAERGLPVGYCQVYSYNINHGGNRVQEKHYFVCCNNIEEKTCQKHTYQKPSMSHSFCSGQVIQQEVGHWQQMESNSFPENGRFYCGGCCGQHLAMDACNQRMQDKWQAGCTNWVQCFQKQCREMLHAVANGHPLKCSVPPAPHPKHFRPELRTLPPNMTISGGEAHPAGMPPGAKNTSIACTEEWCNNILDMASRCRHQCCESTCCLPDGPQDYLHRTLLWGLTTIQVIGITIGITSILAAFTGIALLVVKRCAPVWGSVKVPTNDTQILVIEGPEDADSDREESA